MKKRLIKANDTTDSLFTQFKQIVSIEEICSLIHEVYISWQNANLNKTIDENYNGFSAWFEDYYTSVTEDCIRKANDDFIFHDKYQELSVEEQNQLKNDIEDYIYENKNNINNQLSLKDDVKGE